MTKVLSIIQARMGSTRLPGKVLKDLCGKPLLRWTVDAARASPSIDEVVLATSTLPADDAVENYCKANDIPCFRGSESDVLDRFYQCAKHYKADIVLRKTADCCFLDPSVIEQVIKLREMTNAEYASCCYPAVWPDGLDVECFTFSVLETSWKEATSQIDRDCLTQFVIRNRARFKVVNLACPLPGMHTQHWVCDSPDDFRFCEEVAKRLKRTPPSYVDILNILDKEPELRKINSKSIRNERFYEALADERLLSPRTFTRSQRVLDRATKTIPLGAQTFSKSYLQYPEGAAPLYASHGDGGYVFDVDGNRFVDLVGALCPVILGYCDPDVDEAVRRQMDNGVTLSLSTELEAELAELLCEIIPCAEMVKFGKSGTDVTTAAVRVARAYTGRDHIAVGGYHGWSDWSMGCTNKNIGIPYEIKHLSHKIDPDCNIDCPPRQLAAIIVEPNDEHNLVALRKFCSEWGIVLIFDEIITGFRYDLGGAQKLFDVMPDLACFGKSMANGMPISALVGDLEIMEQFNNPNLHYSGTFFGETLSIAAALATIKKLRRENVIDKLSKDGAILAGHISALIHQYLLADEIDIGGFATLTKLKFNNEQIKSMFISEMIQNGVLIINANSLSFAHKEPELKRIVTAYSNTFAAIRRAIDDGTIYNVKPVVAVPLRTTA